MGYDRLDDLGGVGVACGGAGGCGDVYGWGRVRDVSVAEGPLGSGEVRFSWDGETTEGVDFWCVVDGVPVMRMQPGLTNRTAPLGQGGHVVEVVALESAAASPGIFGGLTGDRVLLVWTARTEADVVRYEVFTDNGTGTVNTAVPAGVVDAVGLGTGWGAAELAVTTEEYTVRVRGDWTGDVINGTLRIVMTGVAGEWELRNEADDVLASGVAEAGLEQGLVSGLRVVWPSAVPEIDLEFGFFAGIRSYWISAERAAGNHKFQVRAVDAAGNAGTLSAVLTVAVAGEIDAPAASVVYTASSRTAAFSWGAVTGAAKYRVYTNYDAGTGLLRDYVAEDGWSTETTGTSWNLVISTTAAAAGGELRAYVRTVDGSGNEERNENMLRVTVGAGAVGNIGVPYIEGVEAGPGGTAVVSWALDVTDGVPVELRIVRGTTNVFASGTAEIFDVPGFDALSIATRVLRGVYTTGAVGGAQGYFWIQGQDDLAAWTTAGEAFGPVVMDSTAPGQVEGLMG